ncbi:MAG TPA: pyridoxal phosphate-dependent aminotransferase, partial [Candidatus Polarisedimenticolaceae bacterium]|nr:pyridoxal phosphate-dependent aminotransferase [Candidatus Polarisedimenticolaceae bacterium]
MTLRPARRLDGIERTLIRRIFDSAPAGAINLGLGQPDLPTPPAAALEGIAAIAAGQTFYTSTAGDPALRAAVAARYGASGPEAVLITIGSQEALFAACLGLVDAGDELLFPDPGYPAYPMVARLIGAEPVAYPLRRERGFRLDPADLLERVGPRTRLVILSCPSNPTGACVGAEDLAALAGGLAERGVPWVSDEIYSAFCWNGAFVSPARFAPQGGLIVSSLSKDVSMTGWRVGWIVGPPPIIARLNAVHQYLVTCASSVS